MNRSILQSWTRSSFGTRKSAAQRRPQRWELMQEIQVNGELEERYISLGLSDGEGTGSAPKQGSTVRASHKY